jgi:rhodanese-related sulfurtransferase
MTHGVILLITNSSGKFLPFPFLTKGVGGILKSGSSEEITVKPHSNWLQAAWQIPALVILSVAAALAVNAVRSNRLPLIGDFSVAARMTTATGERMDITLEEAEKLYFSHTAVFIDARSVEEYAKGHIRDARSLPWQEVDLNFMTVTADLELTTPIITYCDGETCELSHDLALFLRDAGFAHTRVLVNGWSLWQQAGMPVESVMPSAPR